MAALRRRRTEDVNETQEPVEEAQASLDFGFESESTEKQTEQSLEEQAPAESSAESNTEAAPAETGKIVVKRRRIVKKSDDSEKTETNENAEAPSPAASETPSNPEHNNHRRPNQNNNQNRFNKNGNGNGNGKPGKKPFVRPFYPAPSGEVSEQIAAAEAAASNAGDDNANRPRLLINDLTIKSMPELREMAKDYGC